MFLLFAIGIFQATLPQSAHLAGGDVYLTLKDGAERRITYDGKSRDLALSPDRRKIAFLREINPDSSELVVIDVSSQDAPTILKRRGPIPIGEYKLDFDSDPQWSDDGSALYVLLYFGGTTGYIAKVDITTGEVKGLSDAVLYSVVRTGKYRGKLIALKRKSTLVGIWNWYWLLDETGREVGPIGSQDDLEEFKDRYGIGK